jgi:hypothetical protein
MPMDAGGITTIATARVTPQIPSAGGACLEIPDIASVLGTDGNSQTIHSSG